MNSITDVINMSADSVKLAERRLMQIGFSVVRARLYNKINRNYERAILRDIAQENPNVTIGEIKNRHTEILSQTFDNADILREVLK